MDNSSDTEKYLNVVSLGDFKKSFEDIPLDIIHPANKNFPEISDSEDNTKVKINKLKLNLNQRPKVMLSEIEKQIKAIREKSQRIKYYLGEIKL